MRWHYVFGPYKSAPLWMYRWWWWRRCRWWLYWRSFAVKWFIVSALRIHISIIYWEDFSSRWISRNTAILLVSVLRNKSNQANDNPVVLSNVQYLILHPWQRASWRRKEALNELDWQIIRTNRLFCSIALDLSSIRYMIYQYSSEQNEFCCMPFALSLIFCF